MPDPPHANPMNSLTRFCTVLLVIAITALSCIGIYRWGIAMFPSLGPQQQQQQQQPSSSPPAKPSASQPAGGPTPTTSPSTQPPDAESEPGTVPFEDDDAEMNAAIEKARSTADRFARAFKNPCADCDSFTVKKAYANRAGGNEHIWIEVTSIDGDTYTGTVGNDPVDIPGLAYGDEVSGSLGEISDWLYRVRDFMAGGFTVRVIAERAKAEGDTETYKDFKFLPEPK